MTSDPTETPLYASPPCFAHELDDAEPAPTLSPAEVAAWRKDRRAALIAARLAVPAAERQHCAAEIAGHLDQFVNPGPGMIVSLYWPFRGELDLRGWMAEAHGKGARIALPLVEAMGRPLVFREWWPGCAMERGVWNIPNPSGTPVVTPSVVIAPLVGYDTACYRLGYGGGFFDRTLATLSPRPMVIGVGHACAAMATIHPQPHDIPMDVILAGGGRVISRTA
ncbi:MAG: 5-formyltetrahydrofolate cyclo-ligase [Rhodobacteraceae bacterium]|nr:5-formyltetrahydrofolate cyclo-ligase [Paracoccaceae bacterium]